VKGTKNTFTFTVHQTSVKTGNRGENIFRRLLLVGEWKYQQTLVNIGRNALFTPYDFVVI